VMQNLSDPLCYVAFAGGFTLGNFLGVLVEERLAIGNLVVRVITHKNGGEIVAALKAANYGVTSLDARGAKGPVQVILTVIPRKALSKVVRGSTVTFRLAPLTSSAMLTVPAIGSPVVTDSAAGIFVSAEMKWSASAAPAPATPTPFRNLRRLGS